MRYRSNEGFKLTPIWVIIIINFAFLVLYLINREIVVEIFGLNRTDLLNEPWTLVTSMFVHDWPLHFIFNNFALYFFGTSLSRLLGNGRFLMVYFCGGLLGNILFLLLSPSTAIGASGAIFSMFGVLAVMRPKARVMIFPIPLPIPLWIAIVIFIFLSFIPGIAWQAHLGGLIFGLIMGYFFRRKERRYQVWSNF